MQNSEMISVDCEGKCSSIYCIQVKVSTYHKKDQKKITFCLQNELNVPNPTFISKLITLTYGLTKKKKKASTTSLTLH
jgi:hypothetical protein